MPLFHESLHGFGRISGAEKPLGDTGGGFLKNGKTALLQLLKKPCLTPGLQPSIMQKLQGNVCCLAKKSLGAKKTP